MRTPSLAERPALEVEAAQGNLSAATLAESSLIDRASSAVRKHSQMNVPEQTSRPEGDLREQQGRFSREQWDGATAALPSYLYSDDTPRILTTPRASAYIKIAEGCDHPCGFCIIPQPARQVPLAPHLVHPERSGKPDATGASARSR